MGTLFAVAEWHADKAMQAYRDNELDTYARHIAVCDRLRRKAYALKREMAT